MTRRSRQIKIDVLRARVARLPTHSRKRTALLRELVPLVTAEVRSSIRDAKKVSHA